MKMPMLDQPKRRAETVSVFGGYDARDRRGTEGFSEVENLSSSAYPALSPAADAERSTRRSATAIPSRRYLSASGCATCTEAAS